MTDRKPYRHRFPLSVIGYALWLYHRFPLSQRDVQEPLYERGIVVSHETLRPWNITFAPLLTDELRHREPRRGSRWHLDEGFWQLNLSGAEVAHRRLENQAACCIAPLAYSLTRSVGLPHATGDIGNWAEPAGIVSLIVEVAFVVLAVQEIGRSRLRIT